MSIFFCNICGREVTDDEELSTCLSCGGIVCSEDYQGKEGYYYGEVRI